MDLTPVDALLSRIDALLCDPGRRSPDRGDVPKGRHSMSTHNSNATRHSHDLTGVMPIPEIQVSGDYERERGRGIVNINLVGYSLGSGSNGTPLSPDGGHVQVALKMHAYSAARMLIAALERLEAALPGVTADVRQSPMAPYRLASPSPAAGRISAACPHVCEHPAAHCRQASAHSDVNVRCLACNTTWPTLTAYRNGAPGHLPREARSRGLRATPPLDA